MEMIVRRCPSCKKLYLDDVDLCPECPDVVQTKQQNIPGSGKIYSFTRVHVAPEQFQNAVPYFLAIVQMDAGLRCMARLKTQEGDHVRIEAPVELVSVETGYIFALK
ncbi:MAG TPA: OB-fold domain-containing protein [Acidobacteriota bacterium]|jgi:uncharacterized OB-fold protein|nr:OB-fold domain-containing protein [Acidobacteriota bacterium]